MENDEAAKEKIRLLQRSHIHSKIGEEEREYRLADSLKMST